MREAFFDAYVRVQRLTPDWMIGKRSIAHECPASTLCCAAWTPEAALVVAHMGDTLAVLVQTTGSGTLEGRTLGTPHRDYYGAISRCLGGMAHPGVLDFDQMLALVTLTGHDAPRRPYSVVIASDGVWEPVLFTDDLTQQPPEEPPDEPAPADPILPDIVKRTRGKREEPPYGEILAARVAGLCHLCDPDAGTIADSVLRQARTRTRGLQDNATVAVAHTTTPTHTLTDA